MGYPELSLRLNSQDFYLEKPREGPLRCLFPTQTGATALWEAGSAMDPLFVPRVQNAESVF